MKFGLLTNTERWWVFLLLLGLLCWIIGMYFLPLAYGGTDDKPVGKMLTQEQLLGIERNNLLLEAQYHNEALQRIQYRVRDIDKELAELQKPKEKPKEKEVK